eukprot:195505_1
MTELKQILLVENIHYNAAEQFKRAGYSVESLGPITQKDLSLRLESTRALGVRNTTNVSGSVLREATHLRCVGTFCVGTDQVDLKAATELGIPVFNSPFANTRSVAELILAQMIMLTRQLGDRNNEMHSGLWKKSSVACHEIRDHKLGIIGYGPIGQQLSVLAETAGMNVQFTDIIPKFRMGCAKFVESMDTLLGTSDFVVVSVPLTPHTVGMIGKKEIAMMKKGSYLVNSSRGQVVDLDAMASALNSGHLAGCASDVFPNEPTKNEAEFSCPLTGCPNAVLTPHIGGSTEEAQATIGSEVATKVVRYLETGATVGAVNMPNAKLVSHENDSGKRFRITYLFKHHQSVLSSVIHLLSEFVILGQSLATNRGYGYIIIDTEKKISDGIITKLNALEYSVRTRVLL